MPRNFTRSSSGTVSSIASSSTRRLNASHDCSRFTNSTDRSMLASGGKATGGGGGTVGGTAGGAAGGGDPAGGTAPGGAPPPAGGGPAGGGPAGGDTAGGGATGGGIELACGTTASSVARLGWGSSGLLTCGSSSKSF